VTSAGEMLWPCERQAVSATLRLRRTLPQLGLARYTNNEHRKFSHNTATKRADNALMLCSQAFVLGQRTQSRFSDW